MRRRVWGIVGILLVAVGAVLLLSSFSGITGFVVFEGVGERVSSIWGVVLVLGGLGMLMARAHHNRSYEEIARRVYEVLGNRNAYGHKTEQTSVTESRIAAHGPFSKMEVHNVIRGEVGSGRLLLDKSGHAISITTRPEKVREIEKRYGAGMKSTVVDRLHDLEEGHLPAGVR